MASVLTIGASDSELPLFKAVKDADLAGVRTLLERQPQIVNLEANGMTALHWAIQGDHIEVAALLIRSGANVKAKNRFGVLPLSLACERGNADMIDRLLRAGADVNGTKAEGETALMTTARTGNVAAIKVLLANGAKVNSKETWRGQTALMWAASAGHAAATALLIESGADLHARSRAGFTALLFAIREGAYDVARVLLAAGANVNEPVTTIERGNSNGRETGVIGTSNTSALALSILNGHFELAAFLLENGADPNASDPRGSALHILAWMRKPGSPPNSNRPPRPTGNLDSLDLAKVLLAHGANPNARVAWKEITFDRDDGEARGPSNLAVGRVYISQVGATPFYLAARHGDVALMRVLAANGADPLLPTVQKVTPLMAAAGLGYWDGETPGPLTGTLEQERLEAVRLAWELGGDVNAAADFGNIPLEGGGVELLGDYPKNLERLPETALGDVRWTGSTALHGAAVTNQRSIIEFLVEKGAKLDAKNTLGWTPLMIAEGMFVATTSKSMPEAEAELRRLMRLQGLDLSGYDQAHLRATVAKGSR